jgi:hypothetical protein
LPFLARAGGITQAIVMTQQPISKKPAAKPTASMVSVYDGQTYLGSVRVGGHGDAVAYDADGKRIGSFPSERAAMAAFKK